MIRQLWQRLGAAKYVALLSVLTLLSMTAARAQQATRTQLAVSTESGKLTFEAHVSDVSSNPVNDGSVSFETAKGSLGSAFLENGAASLTVNTLPTGTQSVTAVYHPAGNSYAVSASTPAVAEATSTVPGFTVTAAPSSASVTAGGFATILLTVQSVNGFDGTVNLSCSNLPQEATCNFTPVTLTPAANGTITSSLQIATNAPSGVSKNEAPMQRSGGTHVFYAMLLPGGFALFGVFALLRRSGNALRILGMVALLAACSAGLTACGARYGYLLHKPFPNTGTPTGTYSLVVSAYSSNGTGITQATSTSSGCAGAVCVALTVQ